MNELRPGLPYETKAYVCLDVFERRAIGALFADDHPQEGTQYRVVGLGHVVDDDPSINDLLDLQFRR